MARHPLNLTKSRAILAAALGLGALGVVAFVVISTTRASSLSAPRVVATQQASSAAVVEESPSNPSGLFSDAYVAALMDIPEFASRAQSRSAPERRELAMALASRGVSRLDDRGLAERAIHLSDVLDRLDDSLCFAVAVGTPLDPRQWTKVLAAMGESDSLGTCASNWSQAYRAAIVAELTQQPRRHRDPTVSASAISALQRVCDDEERQLFARAGERSSTMADFVAGLRLTYHKLPELSPSERTAVLRLMVQ